MDLIQKYELLIREYVTQLPTVTTQSKLHQLNTRINCLKMVVRDLKASEPEPNHEVETEALNLQRVVGSALDDEFLQSLNDLIDRKLNNEPTKKRF